MYSQKNYSFNYQHNVIGTKSEEKDLSLYLFNKQKGNVKFVCLLDKKTLQENHRYMIIGSNSGYKMLIKMDNCAKYCKYSDKNVDKKNCDVCFEKVALSDTDDFLPTFHNSGHKRFHENLTYDHNMISNNIPILSSHGLKTLPH